MRKIILASHGDYAKGLLDSVRMVVGSLADDITAYGLYEGASAEDYARELEREIAAAPAAEYIIITDIFGASVCTAMMRLTRHRQVRLFTGMNLSMILELLTGYPGPLSESDIVSFFTVMIRRFIVQYPVRSTSRSESAKCKMCRDSLTWTHRFELCYDIKNLICNQ